MEKDKQITTIYVENEIKNYCKKHKINLSEWINTEFAKKHFGVDFKRQQIERLENEIKDLEERNSVVTRSLTARELRYVCQVTPRLREGKDLSSMWKWFCNEYDRKISLEQFNQLVEFHERQAVIRVKKAIDMKKAER